MPLANSETILLEGDDQTKLGGVMPAGHQGGAIHFGKDGKLYVAPGRADRRAPAQAMDSLLGKLLRINPDGSIPEDNPFYRKARGKYRAIWALGLRNPFTFAVQPETGRIFINDVGQAAWEEIDEGFAGANYGWPASEGPTTDPRFRGPIHHYPVASIAGGAFCPAECTRPASRRRFRGRYFFADFVKGWIKVLDPDHPEKVETFATGLARPVDLRVRPGRQPLRASARCVGHRWQLPPWHGVATQDSAQRRLGQCGSIKTALRLFSCVVLALPQSPRIAAQQRQGRFQERRGQPRPEPVRLFV